MAEIFLKQREEKGRLKGRTEVVEEHRQVTSLRMQANTCLIRKARELVDEGKSGIRDESREDPRTCLHYYARWLGGLPIQLLFH